MFRININDTIYSLPSTWEEIIDCGHYLDVVRELMPEADISVRNLNIFRKLTGFNMSGMGITNEGISQLSTALVTDVFPLLDYIYDSELIFTANPLREITIGETIYTGPLDKLRNQTGESWMISYHCQIQYSKAHDLTKLYPLVAQNYGCTIAEVAALDPAIVYGIYVWYCKCELWWQDMYEWLFPEPDGEKKGKPATGLEIKEMIMELAGNSLGPDWDVVKMRTREDIIWMLDRLEDKRIAAQTKNDD